MQQHSALSTQHSALAVKICGLREPEHLCWVREGGATMAGLVFATSRRQVTVARAQQIARAATHPIAVENAARASQPHFPLLVGVFANQPADEVAGIAAACRLDMVQLSGHEPAEVTSTLARGGLRVIKVVHVQPGIAAQAVLESMVPHVGAGAEIILLDTASAQGGGSGHTFDWSIAREVIAGASIPIMLAGGLTPGNVAAAVEAVHPFGVDVSSGVETDGIKDRRKIEAFIQAARARGPVGSEVRA